MLDKQLCRIILLYVVLENLDPKQLALIVCLKVDYNAHL